MLAVNASNPSLLAGTAFTPDPMGGPLAPIYISTDGGRTWTLNSIVPSQEGVSLTGDITIAFGPRSHDLYAGILRFPAPPGDTRLNVLRARNFRGSTPMKVLLDRLLSDVEAASIVGVSATGFRNYVTRGLMPAPRRLGRRTRWILTEIIAALRRLPR